MEEQPSLGLPSFITAPVPVPVKEKAEPKEKATRSRSAEPRVKVARDEEPVASVAAPVPEAEPVLPLDSAPVSVADASAPEGGEDPDRYPNGRRRRRYRSRAERGEDGAAPAETSGADS